MGARGKRNQIIYRDTQIISNTAGMKELTQLTYYEAWLVVDIDRILLPDQYPNRSLDIIRTKYFTNLAQLIIQVDAITNLIKEQI